MLDFNKIFVSVRDAVAETFWPTRCVGCDMPGELLCASCRAQLPHIDTNTACPRCGAPWGAVVCTECPQPGATKKDGEPIESPFAFEAARCACSYEGVASELITAYKDGDERRLAPFIATEICHVAGEDWLAWAQALVSIPANPINLRRRGWDHMSLIAQEVAQQSGLPLLDALASLGAADQRMLSRDMRAANRAGSFVLRDEGLCLPQRLLLIDDVLTTGATCSAAAAVLKEAGAQEVRVVTFARVW